MSYRLSDEHEELRRTVAEFARTEVAPVIGDYYERAAFPYEIVAAMGRMGLFGLPFPEDVGGMGGDYLALCLALEELARVDSSVAITLEAAVSLGAMPIYRFGTPEQQATWLPRLCSGEALGAFGLTEPEGGSDAGATRTTARLDAGEWVINGTKCFASNAPNAEYFIIFAWTDKSKRASQGVSAFFVEKDRGVQLGKKENKMGLHLSETSDVILDNVRVPADHMIGEPGKGFGMALGGISGAGAIVNCAPLLGMSQACIEQAVEYTQQRRQFGSRVVDFQAVGFMIADMEMRTQACRSMVYDALRAADEGVKTNLDLCIKAYTSDCTMQTALDTVQVMGGYGYMKEYPAERWMRNAKIFQIFGGTNQVKRKNLLKTMIERDPMKARK